MKPRTALVWPIIAALLILSYSGPRAFDGTLSPVMRAIHAIIDVLSVWSAVIAGRRWRKA
jgi:hypothetical protein